MWSKITNALKSHTTGNKGVLSHQLDLSSFRPPGLDLDINAPNFSLDSSVNERSGLLPDGGNDYPMMSTSCKLKDAKGKEEGAENEESQEAGVQITVPKVVDEINFHAQEKSPKKLAPPLRELGQSLSFGQTMFFSTSEVDKTSTTPNNAVVPSSTEHKPASNESQKALPISTSAETRTQSMSDTVFQTMLCSSSSQPSPPEDDNNDESTTGIIIHSGGTSEPDPFSAHATTYCTPQTMIATTPPEDILKHGRKISKEETLIISLQTQLALKTELCGHYETDLKARDELVEILGKKLANLEEDGTQHKNVLRSWKKKVQELERVCRQLEEIVEDSRQESMDRSIMDEASSEALRMLHCQIATLERGKNEWLKKEQGLREEVEELKTRTSMMEVEWNESKNKKNELEIELQEVWNLKDTLEKVRDELEDALQQAREEAAHLAHDLQERNDRVSELEQERQFTNDNITRLEENLRTRDAEISQISQRVLERESEVENLHDEISTIKREHDYFVNEQTRALRDAADQEDESKARVDLLVRAKAEADVEIKTSRDCIDVLKEEVERLRRHVHSLQQESADKEVKIVQMTEQHSLDKEDLQGLNIALDSKQQELQILKKKNGVKGTAGSAQPSKLPVSHRRESSIFTATPVQLQPPSAISDSGTDTMHIPGKNVSLEMSASSTKVLALGKSKRVNGSGTSSVSSSANRTVVRAGMDGSIMGPLPSNVGTPTPSAKGLSLSRSSSARHVVTTPSTFYRTVSSSSVNPEHKTKISWAAVNAAPSVLEKDEKENVNDASSRTHPHPHSRN